MKKHIKVLFLVYDTNINSLAAFSEDNMTAVHYSTFRAGCIVEECYDHYIIDFIMTTRPELNIEYDSFSELYLTELERVTYYNPILHEVKDIEDLRSGVEKLVTTYGSTDIVSKKDIKRLAEAANIISYIALQVRNSRLNDMNEYRGGKQDDYE